MFDHLLQLSGKVMRRFYSLCDFLRYFCAVLPYRAYVRKIPQPNKGSLLIVSGRGMNISWAQIWSMLSIAVRLRGYNGLVLTMRKQRLLNLYFFSLGLKPVYIDEYPHPITVPEEIENLLSKANNYDSYSAISYKQAPVGQIALSTYSRHYGTGLIDYDDSKVRNYVNDWVVRICFYYDMADALYHTHNVTMLFFTEVFMEEYGAFYYAALNSDRNIVRFAGTIRDDAFILQHLTRSNDRIHHSSIDTSTWNAIKNSPVTNKIESELMQNFQDRYGARWHRSKRNHPNTIQMGVEDARAQLGIKPGRKVAVIYSHILYDTLFFFGTDLFEDYSKWLVETVRAAIENPQVDWLVKVHPSNLWRGEIDSLLKGKYEEEKLLKGVFGALPSHVRIVGADTNISPLTWFQMADYGVTVRGTSGLEMSALGKTVITAGTGRYEGNGFTVDPKDALEYISLLKSLHNLEPPSDEQIRLAKLYAHAIFIRKPVTLTSVRPRLRTGCKKVQASDDLVYIPVTTQDNMLGRDMSLFAEWAENSSQRDLLN